MVILRTLLSLLLLALPLAAGSSAKPLSQDAQKLIHAAFGGLPPGSVLDAHVHLVGLGKGGTQAWVNPKKLTMSHPTEWLRTRLYAQAGGVKQWDHLDQEFEARLVERAGAFERPLRAQLLAFDYRYHADGSPDLLRSEFYIPNDYLIEVSRRHPDLFVPVISVNPVRKDACEALRRFAGMGVRYVKWLPNAQGIDPANPHHDTFYRTMKELDMVLLTHVGEEKAVKATEDQKLGNPLKFRRALDLGVKIIMAHCASLGDNEDLDHPGQRATNFSLFLRLMAEKKYEGQLFGDISAITQVNRLPGPLLEILERPDLQARLINGSDYPLPGIDLVIWTRKLVAMKLITPSERKALNEIFKANPLLFDFVLKRTLHTPDGKRLRASIFVPRADLPEGRLK